MSVPDFIPTELTAETFQFSDIPTALFLKRQQQKEKKKSKLVL